MELNRKDFIASVVAVSACSLASAAEQAAGTGKGDSEATEQWLAEIAAKPILTFDQDVAPVVVRDIELLKNGANYLVRCRSEDGAEGIAIPNVAKMKDFYPVFVNRIAPFFARKDLRNLESLQFELYRDRSNYKLQGMGLWVPYAAAEMAMLDLLGKRFDKPLGELLGGVRRRRIAVYRASSNRGNSVESEIDHLRRLAEETGGKALKFRLGGRMSRNADSRPGRTEGLIKSARPAFPDFTLYGDSNSSYDVDEAIRIGRLMEEHNYGFFEEPCPFDHLWETQMVASALQIPIAGGEQEYSMRRFRWSLANRVVDVAQPDLHYFGGYLRTIRVARMANALGMPCTVHMSGGGLGYVDTCHLASCIEDPGPFQEFKGATSLPVQCDTSSLKPKDGFVDVPTGPGYGIEVDPGFIRRAERVR
jgi:L-alanine-DL-glutamate epimerase-like enolase superfamily enzyme